VVPVVEQSFYHSDANVGSVAIASAPAIDLIAESFLPGSYISEPQPISAGSRETLQLAATGEYDLRTLRDDLLTDSTGDMFGDSLQISIDIDDSLDLLADSPVAIPL
jgi:hypothetical protein